MAATVLPLVRGVLLTTSPTIYYTAPDIYTGWASHATFCNLTPGAVSVTVWRVPEGEVGGDQFAILRAYSIAANTTYRSLEIARCSFETGDMLMASASAGNAIAFQVHGVEVT